MVRPETDKGVLGRDNPRRSVSVRAAKSKRSARGRGGEDKLVLVLVKENSDSERFRLSMGILVGIGCTRGPIGAGSGLTAENEAGEGGGERKMVVVVAGRLAL